VIRAGAGRMKDEFICLHTTVYFEHRSTYATTIARLRNSLGYLWFCMWHPWKLDSSKRVSRVRDGIYGSRLYRWFDARFA
jgi:hypothetical protein